MLSKEQVYQDFIQSYTQLLKEKAPKHSGALASSIEGNIEGDDITFSMLGYGLIVDKGINGTDKNNGSPYSFSTKRPPISSLISFASSIGTNPYALQNSIFKNGFKAQPFIEQDSEIEEFANNLTEAIFNDFANNIK